MSISNPLSSSAKATERAKNEEREPSPEATKGGEPASSETISAPKIQMDDDMPRAEIDQKASSVDEAVDNAGFFQPKGDPYKYRFSDDGSSIQFYNPETGKTGRVGVNDVPSSWMNQVKEEGYLPPAVSLGQSEQGPAGTEKEAQDPSGSKETVEKKATVEVGEPKPVGEAGPQGEDMTDFIDLAGDVPESNVGGGVAKNVLSSMGVINTAVAEQPAKQMFDKIVRNLRSLSNSGSLAEQVSPEVRGAIGQLSANGVTADTLLNKANQTMAELERAHKYRTADKPQQRVRQNEGQNMTEWERRSSQGRAGQRRINKLNQ